MAFVHGAQGTGKTSTARMFKRLCGYKDAKPHSSKEKAFPMLKLLCSTNAIPVFLDEFKAKLLTEDQMNNLIAYMNKAYSGETEVKGQADQTTKDYVISAPLCVMGEWNISVPSVHERILVMRFRESVKKDKTMQLAYENVWKLNLETFMPRYIQFCLQQNVDKLFVAAKKTVEQHFGAKVVAPRIVNNLSVLVLGIELFKLFGKANGVVVPAINIPAILDNQLSEITGSQNGFVRSAVDQLINELSIMAMKEKPKDISEIYTRFPNGSDAKIREGIDYKIVSGCSLAINFRKIFPDFKQYARQTNYEGDLLDYISYMRQFEECSYIESVDHVVNLNGKTARCISIDIGKAREAGINLEGFGII